MKRPLTAIATAAAGLLVLAACSSTSHTMSPGSMSTMPMTATSSPAVTPEGGATPATGPHSQADVTFATDMIPHHRQAVQMADMALSQATNSDVTALAQAIKAAQDPEITQMSGWLTGWKQPVPSASTSSMAGMGGMDHTGTGMMSDADMTSLGNASGATFDRMWVTMMIQHHQGAITMAKTEQTTGQNPDAKALAQSIITNQSAQITQLSPFWRRCQSREGTPASRSRCPMPVGGPGSAWPRSTSSRLRFRPADLGQTEQPETTSPRARPRPGPPRTVGPVGECSQRTIQAPRISARRNSRRHQ